MRRNARRLSLAALCLSAFLSVDGLASAHEFDAPSTVTLDRLNTFKPNSYILSGQVQSSQNECEQGRQVTLGGKSTTTDNSGDFFFTVKAKKKRRTYTASVAAFVEGVHPHRHACGGDSSPGVRVPKKKKKN